MLSYALIVLSSVVFILVKQVMIQFKLHFVCWCCNIMLSMYIDFFSIIDVWKAMILLSNNMVCVSYLWGCYICFIICLHLQQIMCSLLGYLAIDCFLRSKLAHKFNYKHKTVYFYFLSHLRCSLINFCYNDLKHPVTVTKPSKDFWYALYATGTRYE